MELKHINKEIRHLATMEANNYISKHGSEKLREANNYISKHGSEKLREFRYLKSLHQEKVKSLNVTWTAEQILNIIKDNEHLDDLRIFFTEHGI